MELRKKYGNWVLIVGAAKGLGEAYSRSLAGQGFNLLMIDNRGNDLISLSAELVEQYNIETKTLILDLFEKESVDLIMKELLNREIRLLIYVAAFSQIRQFKNFTSGDLDHYLQINMGTLLHLVHAFSQKLITANETGGILLMSSLAGLTGMQYIVPYAATKAFTWNLAESLYHELRPFNIDVMACIAGATATEAYLGTKPKYGFIKPQVQKPSEVAKLALKNLGKKALFIPGFSNRFNYFILTRLLPRKWASYFANKTMKRMYAENVTF